MNRPDGKNVTDVASSTTRWSSGTNIHEKSEVARVATNIQQHVDRRPPVSGIHCRGCSRGSPSAPTLSSFSVSAIPLTIRGDRVSLRKAR